MVRHLFLGWCRHQLVEKCDTSHAPHFSQPVCYSHVVCIVCLCVILTIACRNVLLGFMFCACTNEHLESQVLGNRKWSSLSFAAQTPLMLLCTGHNIIVQWYYTSSTLTSGCCSKYLNRVWYNTSMVPDCTLVHTARGPTPRNQPAMPSVL